MLVQGVYIAPPQIDYMKKYFTLLCLLTVFSTLKAQYVGLNKAEISRLKAYLKTDATTSNIYTDYLNDANKALSERPNPRDTIVSEGHLKGDPNKTASALAMKDYRKVYALSLAYNVEGKKEYLDKAIEYLKAWATVNHPTGNPINDTKLDYVMMGYDMIRSNVSESDRQIIDNWLVVIAEKELLKGTKGKATVFNNWHSHRLKVVGQIGFILNDKKFTDYATIGIEKQVETNLNPDGSTYDFLQRDALHYHLYDLEPLTTLSIIIKRATGVDEFRYISPTGTSIKKSTDWLLPYVTGEKTHEEYVNSKVAFDKARADNHEQGFQIGHLFQPEKALYLLSLASYFDSNYTTIINQLKKRDSDVSEWQLVLNKIMK